MVNQMYSIDVPLYVTKTLHLDAQLVGWMAGLGAALEIPIMIVAGRFAERFGRLRLVIASAAGAASSLYSSAFMSAGLLAGAITAVTAAAIGSASVFWVCAALAVVAAALLLARAASRP